MARRVIDLSQPLSKDSQLHPFFPTVQVLRHLQHSDAQGDEKSFDAQIIITSNHAATHVDALGHFDPDPNAAKIEVGWVKNWPSSPRCRATRPSTSSIRCEG